MALRDVRHVCDGRDLRTTIRPGAVCQYVWDELILVYREAELCGEADAPKYAQLLARLYTAVNLQVSAAFVHSQPGMVMAMEVVSRRINFAQLLREYCRAEVKPAGVLAKMVERLRQIDSRQDIVAAFVLEATKQACERVRQGRAMDRK